MKNKDKTKFGVILLAGGRGKRMHSKDPKVLTRLGGHPMIVHVLRSIQGTSPRASVVIVVGDQKEKIIEEVKNHQGSWFPDLEVSFAEQPLPLGTGDAV